MKLKEYRDRTGNRRCLYCGKLMFMRRVFCSDLHSTKFTHLLKRMKRMATLQRLAEELEA